MSRGADPRTRLLLLLGLLAGPGYVVVSLTNLIITGLLVIAGAFGLRRRLRPGIGSTWPPRLLAGYGLSMIAAGIFRADPALGFPATGRSRRSGGSSRPG